MRSGGLQRQMEDAAEATDRIRDRAEETRERVRATIRLIEERLARALDGAPLRGMREIAKGYWGAHVRATGRFGVDTYVSRGERVLAVGKTGRLELVTRDGDERVYYESATGEDLTVLDLQDYVRTLRIVLRRHIAATQRSERTHARAADLAERLQRAMAGA